MMALKTLGEKEISAIHASASTSPQLLQKKTSSYRHGPLSSWSCHKQCRDKGLPVIIEIIEKEKKKNLSGYFGKKTNSNE